MKNFKKILLTGTITIATLLTMSVVSKADTVKVTGDVINIRKEASADSSVIAMLSKDVECEYLGEEGEWYKIKYQKYTGYVSKQYAKLIANTSDSTENTNQENNTQINDSEQNSNKNENEINNQNTEQKDNEENNGNNDNTQPKNEKQLEKNTQIDTVQLVYKKFNQDTIIRILPLIHSSNIGEAKKNDEVLILTETSGWSYIQTDEINGWVRTNTLGEAKTATEGNSIQDDEDKASTEKTGYISEDDVNMREGAGTSYSIVKVLSLNTQVTILDEDGNWYKVKSGNTTGYVSKDYISDSKTVTNRSLSKPRTEKEDDENEATAENTTSRDKVTATEDTTLNNIDARKEKDTTDTDITTTSTTANKSNKTTSTKTTTSSDTIKGTDVIAYAKRFLGYKYVWAGDGSNGTFDCSGFTMYVYNHFGVSLPHYTVSQYNSSKGTKITKQGDLKMGDIVFLTDYETGAACGHCGIYISDGDFIHADSSVGYVNISSLNGIYKGRFCGALRIIK